MMAGNPFDNIDVDENLPRSYQCDICYQPAVNASVCAPCGHSFCGSCVSRMRREHMLNRCATCRSNVESLVRNRFAEAILSAVNGTCRLCQNVFPLSVVDEHFANCGAVSIQCGRCMEEFPRREQEDHQEQCEMMVVLCECGDEFVRRDERIHRESACGHRLVDCPLACGNLVKRALIPTHVRACPSAVVKCCVAGCGEMFTRGEKQRHQESSMEKHLMLFDKEHSRLLWETREGTVAVRISEMETAVMTWKIPRESQAPISSPRFEGFNRLWRLTCEAGLVGIHYCQGVDPLQAKIAFFITLHNGMNQVLRRQEPARLGQGQCLKLPLLTSPEQVSTISVRIEEMKAVRV